MKTECSKCSRRFKEQFHGSHSGWGAEIVGRMRRVSASWRERGVVLFSLWTPAELCDATRFPSTPPLTSLFSLSFYSSSPHLVSNQYSFSLTPSPLAELSAASFHPSFRWVCPISSLLILPFHDDQTSVSWRLIFKATAWKTWTSAELMPTSLAASQLSIRVRFLYFFAFTRMRKMQ